MRLIRSAKLVAAWARYPDKKPVIPADEHEELHARRLVAQRCLYGVDKNPLATDLAKLSLWLATLARDHEFTFLDHALKSGDSLVGLTQEQIAAAHWDISKPGLPLFRQLVKDRVVEAMKGRAEIQAASDETARAIQEARHRSLEARVRPIRAIGDAVIATFFAEDKPKAREKKRAEVESQLSGSMETAWDKLGAMAATLKQGAHPLTPFHWQIEFPEVFARENGGFDAIVGNPPFLSGSRTSQINGATYFQYLLESFENSKHQCDTIAFFFRLAFNHIRSKGACGLLATKTLAQGDTRESSLREILSHGATIYRVQKRLPWPGEASVLVSIVHFARGRSAPVFFDGRVVNRISAFLVPGHFDDSPFALGYNPYFSKGSQVYGQGFVFDDKDANANPLERLDRIRSSKEEWKRIFPVFGGVDFNQQPEMKPDKWVLNLSDIEAEDGLKAFPNLYEIARSKVKPERDRLPDNSNNKPLKRKWWAYQAPRPELYQRLSQKRRCIGHAEVSPYVAFRMVDTGPIFIKTVIIIDLDEWSGFASLQARIHEVWARFFASTLEDRLRYTPSDCFETFPFPIDFKTSTGLGVAGETYHDHRTRLMVGGNEGMTKVYNRFHDRRETSKGIECLRELHRAMDRAVLEAYGWHDLAMQAEPIFLHETNEDDHTYQDRLFWPSDFRDEVLARLLSLNAERHAEEVRRGIAPGMKAGKKGQEDELEDK